MYNKKGDERYPDFKLYRMIAKTVHHCLPEDQLENPLFNQFKLDIVGDSYYIEDFIMNIDSVIKND